MPSVLGSLALLHAPPGAQALRVLVTGALGFIGGHVVEVLASRGHEVFGLDDYSSPSPRSVEVARSLGVRVYRVRLPDVGAVTRLASTLDVDAIVHLAARVSVEESLEEPTLYFEVNAAGTASVAEAARSLGVHLIHASSAAVYGEPEVVPIPEEHPRRPLNPYGASKAAAELLLETLPRLKWTSLRFFNVYGPGQQPSSPYSGVIARFVERALRGEPLVVYGDGRQTRDFIYARDVAEAVARAVEGKPLGRHVNVGSGVEVSVLELAEIVQEVTGRRVGVVFAEPRPGDVRRSCARIDLARSLLRWEPRTSLREGIRATAEWIAKESH